MSFLLENWLLVFMALSSGGLLLWQTLQKSTGGDLSPQDAVRLMNREKGVLIDVATAEEFAAGHPAGARNLPLASLDGGAGLPANKQLPLVLTCASGARAARAAVQLRKAGYEKAAALSGGNKAWREAGLPIERGAAAPGKAAKA